MAQKYEIYHESGWDENTNSPTYEKLTTLKNEQSAMFFINDVENLGKYGNMIVKMKHNGETLTYNDESGKWE